ncbi:MAG TPA: cell envelope biogenesis protein TolA [Allosphingosinicella sp.]|nr:cell envelope biogenesis protein TolA [Allosphingosinicella sp.]
MDRAETTGLGVALVAHGALFAALSLGIGAANLPRITGDPIEVSFADETGLVSSAPVISSEAPAPSLAPELGAPEEAAPASAPAVAPPLPDRPSPQPAQKASQPAAQPQPKQKSSAAGTRTKTSGSRFGDDFMKGLNDVPSASRSQVAPAATMSAEALASIKAVIERQIQPCADRQRDPGPGANQIRVTLNLRLNRDGSLAQKPVVVRTAGVDAENGRYEARVRDLAIAAYVGCSPLRELPEDLYRTPKGGWSNLNMTYRLP